MRRRLIPASNRTRGRTSRVAGRRPRGESTKAPGADPVATSRRYVELVANVAGSATLIGALLYYFGWARAAATFRYFGIEIGLLDLSFQDYLLRSVRSTYFPLLTLVVIWLAALLLHRLIAGSRLVSPTGITLVAVGIAALVVGGLANFGYIRFSTAWPVIPALLLAGALACSYGADLLMTAGGTGPDVRRSVPASERALVGVVLVLLLFWLVSSYANFRGTRNAIAIDRDLELRPGVVVLSAGDLHLRGAGVTAEPLEGEDSAYRFCYRGLRYLVRSGGRQFLLPEHWQRGRDPVAVIRESDAVLFEFYSSVRPPSCPR
jgi:hypothetical protein